jgi:type VI secretion system protein ImpF
LPEPYANTPVQKPLLDRLLSGGTTAASTSFQRINDLKQSVRRDLEALLNTRWRCTDLPEEMEELEQSLANYGVPDVTGAAFAGPQSRAELIRLIERAIKRFEPRLRSVRLSLVNVDDPMERTLRFKIDAVLCVDPIEERVLFDSVLEPARSFKVMAG